MKKIVAYCGIHCDECEAFIATEAGDDLALKRIARKWSTETLWFTAKDVCCRGCTEQRRAVFGWAKDCPLRACCQQKNIPDCTHCNEFPCVIVEQSPPGVKARLIALKKKT